MFGWHELNRKLSEVNAYLNVSTRSISRSVSISSETDTDDQVCSTPLPPEPTDCQSCNIELDALDCEPVSAGPLSDTWKTNSCVSLCDKSKDNSTLPYFAPIEDDFLVIASGNGVPERSVISSNIDQNTAKIESQQMLCEKCADLTHQTIDDEIVRMEKECAMYSKWIIDNDYTDEELEVDEKSYDLDITKLIAQIGICDKILLESANERVVLKQEIQEINTQIRHKIAEGLHYQYATGDLIDQETWTNTNGVDATTDSLEQLLSHNILDLVFKIDTSSEIATINDCPLGIDVNATAETNWRNINEAWGQLIPLFNTLYFLLDIQISFYKLVPMSHHSYIEVIPSDTQKAEKLELHCTFFGNNDGYDKALTTVLHCAGQLARDVLRRFPDLQLPHTVESSSIRHGITNKFYSIKMANNTEISWTSVLRMFMEIVEGILIRVNQIEMSEDHTSSEQLLIDIRMYKQLKNNIIDEQTGNFDKHIKTEISMNNIDFIQSKTDAQ